MGAALGHTLAVSCQHFATPASRCAQALWGLAALHAADPNGALVNDEPALRALWQRCCHVYAGMDGVNLSQVCPVPLQPVVAAAAGRHAAHAHARAP